MDHVIEKGLEPEVDEEELLTVQHALEETKGQDDIEDRIKSWAKFLDEFNRGYAEFRILRQMVENIKNESIQFTADNVSKSIQRQYYFLWKSLPNSTL